MSCIWMNCIRLSQFYLLLHKEVLPTLFARNDPFGYIHPCREWSYLECEDFILARKEFCFLNVTTECREQIRPLNIHQQFSLDRTLFYVFLSKSIASILLSGAGDKFLIQVQLLYTNIYLLYYFSWYTKQLFFNTFLFKNVFLRKSS